MTDTAARADTEVGLPRSLTKRPPTIWDTIYFWFWHVIAWAFYILLSIVYIPWAFAMHFVLLALLAATCPALYWRIPRKVHLYVYVIVIMVPGKFLWYNLFRYNRRKGKVWDYEMGKPTPVQVEKRRRLSVTDQAKPQTSSPLFTKLPPEIRLRIYRHLILGDSQFLNIAGWRPDDTKRSKNIKIRAYPWSWDDDDRDKDPIPLTQAMRSLHQRPWKGKRVEGHQMGLPLLQTCRKVYTEAIDMFYTLPTFSFRDLNTPPFFLRTVLPDRLALIRSIHLLYDQKAMSMKRSHIACSTAKYTHKVGQCVFCNPIHWFSSIGQYMTGLKDILIFIFMIKHQSIPDMGKTWIARMLELQVGPNGLRNMHIDVSPSIISVLDRDFMLDEEEYITRVKKFNGQLQQRLKKGRERYTAKCQTEDKVEAAPTAPSASPDKFSVRATGLSEILEEDSRSTEAQITANANSSVG